jgi:hypothetical protein
VIAEVERPPAGYCAGEKPAQRSKWKLIAENWQTLAEGDNCG